MKNEIQANYLSMLPIEFDCGCRFKKELFKVEDNELVIVIDE